MSEESTVKPTLKLSTSIPDIYWKCQRVFGVHWDRGVVITYGDTVYCKYPLPPDLLIHEATHVEQQTKMGAEKWWEKYFEDVKFRLEQETAAYLNQAKFIRANHSRPVRRTMFKKLAKDMSRMYGGMCTEEQATEILNKA